MPTYTTKEDMAFAECCPFTIYRDGVAILATVGTGEPLAPANDADRALAEEVRAALESKGALIAALKALQQELRLHVKLASLSASNGDRDVYIDRMRAADAAIAKAEGRANG